MTPLELKFVFFCFGLLLSVLGFIGALGVRALIKMANDINEIKVAIMEVNTKHDSLEKRVTNLETV